MASSPDKLKMVRQFQRRDVLFSIARVPGSAKCYVGSSDFRVYAADLAQASPTFTEIGKHDSYVTGVALAGSQLVSGSYDGKLILWDIQKKAAIRSVEAHKKWIRGVFASPDGKTLASVADDMVCRLWNAATGKQLLELKGHQEKTPNDFPSMLYAAAFSADGKYLATGDKIGKVIIWDTATGKQVGACEAPVMYTWDPVQRIHSIGGIRSLAFSPDGVSLAVGGMGKVGNIDHLEGKTRVEVFDWKKGKQTHEFSSDKFRGLINHLEFHPKGEWLVGAGGAGDGVLAFYSLTSKKPLREEKVPMHVHDLCLSDDYATLYLVGHNRLAIYEMK
jgi:WD40 repeat protein